MLLTDGQPNILPPLPHLDMLREYKAEHHKELDFTLSTFGFGYSLDTQLLEGLSVEGHGIYSFIPDAAMVGTVFVNFLANILSTTSQEVCVCIRQDTAVDAKLQLTSLVADQELSADDDGSVKIHLTMQAEQSRDIVLRCGPGLPQMLEISASANEFKAPLTPVTLQVGTSSQEPSLLLEVQRLRELTSATISKAAKMAGR